MRSGLKGVRGEWEKGGNWLALPADMNGDVKEKKGREVRDERQGRRKKDKDSDGEYKNRESKRNGEGGMPESNGLIQGLSSMESRACQIACNQQPSPLSDGGIVHVEGKQRINTEWSFCSGDVVSLHLTKPADETAFA